MLIITGSNLELCDGGFIDFIHKISGVNLRIPTYGLAPKQLPYKPSGLNNSSKGVNRPLDLFSSSIYFTKILSVCVAAKASTTGCPVSGTNGFG